MNLKLERKYWIPASAATLLLILVCISVNIFGSYNYFADTRINIFDRTKDECPGLRWVAGMDSNRPTYPVRVEGDLYFCGERVPLEDPDVRERLERELQLNVYWQSNTLMCMKLANRYFDEVEATLKTNGVPTDFKYLALIESNFRSETSPVGATGFWQLMKPTATSYNLVVNDEVDERYNIEKSTVAACKYLKEAKERFGNWTIAGASYNLGMPSMAQRIRDQRTSNYYDMYFNQETSRYIFRMLAMKIVFSNPQMAGFKLKPEELYQPYKYKVLEIDSGISDVAGFASNFGLKYKHIKLLNPWMRDARLTNKEGRKYQVRIMQAD